MAFAVIHSLVLMRLQNFFLQKIKTYLETKIASTGVHSMYLFTQTNRKKIVVTQGIVLYSVFLAVDIS